MNLGLVNPISINVQDRKPYLEDFVGKKLWWIFKYLQTSFFQGWLDDRYHRTWMDDRYYKTYQFGTSFSHLDLHLRSEKTHLCSFSHRFLGSFE